MAQAAPGEYEGTALIADPTHRYIQFNVGEVFVDWTLTNAVC